MPALRDDRKPLEARLGAARVGAFLDADDDEFLSHALAAATEVVVHNTLTRARSSVRFVARLVAAADRGLGPGRVPAAVPALILSLSQDEPGEDIWTYENWVAAGGPAGHWKPVDAALGGRLVGRLADAPFSSTRRELTARLGVVAGRLDAPDATRLAAHASDLLAGRLAAEARRSDRAELAAGLGGLAEWLKPEVARTATTLVMEHLTEDSSAVKLLGRTLWRSESAAELGGGLRALASRLSAEEATPLAARLVDRLSDETDSDVLEGVSVGLGALLRRMDPKAAAPLAAKVATRLVSQLTEKGERRPLRRLTRLTRWFGIGDLTVGLDVLAPHLSDTSATPLAARLVDAMSDERDTLKLEGLAAGLGALARRADGRLVGVAAARQVAKMADADNTQSLADLAIGLGYLGRWSESGEPAGLSGAAAARLLKQLDEVTGTSRVPELFDGLAALTPQLDHKDADRVAHALLRQLFHLSARRSWRDPFLLLSVAPLVGGRSLISNLPADERRRWAGRVLDSPLAALDGESSEVHDWVPWRNAFADLPDDLPTCVEWLKAPTCGGLLRQAFLRKAGTLAGHEFRTVWEFEAWARVNRPDLNFTSPPRKP